MIYNVLGYGATGTASSPTSGHDDTVGIQAAYDAARAAGGGSVYFPKTS
jgi:polygalacturonase